MIHLSRPFTAGAILGLLALGGCGFTPLYATGGVAPILSSIEVLRPDGRTGYLLGQSLDDDFAKGEGEAKYRLALKLHETRIPRGLRVNNVASRYELLVTADYELIEAKTRKSVTKGSVSVDVSYDSADQPYAGVAAQLDGQQRAASEAAQRIRTELASYFASPRPSVALGSAASAATYSERLESSAIVQPRERARGATDTPTPVSPADAPPQN